MKVMQLIHNQGNKMRRRQTKQTRSQRTNGRPTKSYRTRGRRPGTQWVGNWGQQSSWNPIDNEHYLHFYKIWNWN